MKKTPLLILTVTCALFSLPSTGLLQRFPEDTSLTEFNNDSLTNCPIPQKISYQDDDLNIELLSTLKIITPDYPNTAPRSLSSIKNMLHTEAKNLSAAAIDKTITTLKCASAHNVEHNPILTIIDFSLPSSKKRLWIFDLNQQKLLFHTYVSHGIKSGFLLSNNFSNKHDSKSSSIGVYKTEKSYYGREGLTLRLEGLEPNFNDNAMNRYIVMHGGWYMDEHFIKKYGRAGRSWGCPAIPLNLVEPIINTIKENSLVVAYYPNENWLIKSRFLTCDNHSPAHNMTMLPSEIPPASNETEEPDYILFADLNNNNHHEENEPIVAISADNYQQLFHKKPPLTRMLRRQINHAEYIALSNAEFKTLVTNTTAEATQSAGRVQQEISVQRPFIRVASTTFPIPGQVETKGNDLAGTQATPENNQSTANNLTLDAVYFIIPVIKMVRGYYETEMHPVTLGKIKSVTVNPGFSTKTGPLNNYTVHFDTKSVTLKSTNQFIRWLGL